MKQREQRPERDTTHATPPGAAAIASLVLGVVGVCAAGYVILQWYAGLLGLLLAPVWGVVAMVLGLVAMGGAARRGGAGRGLGIAGLVLGAIAIVVSVLLLGGGLYALS